MHRSLEAYVEFCRASAPGPYFTYPEEVHAEIGLSIDPMNMAGVGKVRYICPDDIHYYEQTTTCDNSVDCYEPDRCMAMMTVEKGNAPHLGFVAVRVLLVTSGIMLAAAGLVRMEKKTETP